MRGWSSCWGRRRRWCLLGTSYRPPRNSEGVTWPSKWAAHKIQRFEITTTLSKNGKKNGEHPTSNRCKKKEFKSQETQWNQTCTLWHDKLNHGRLETSFPSTDTRVPHPCCQFHHQLPIHQNNASEFSIKTNRFIKTSQRATRPKQCHQGRS